MPVTRLLPIVFALAVAACTPTAPAVADAPTHDTAPASVASQGSIPPSASAAPLAADQTAGPPNAEPTTTASARAAASSQPAGCPAVAAPAGFERCEAVELTGAPPCEAICRRPRQASGNACCTDPVDVVVLSGAREQLRIPACSFVPPECANVHGHGNMSASLHVLPGTPPEIIVVEGGCEARAMAHGYVPPGVAAWTGCNHQRYRWDGGQFALLKK